MNGVNHCTHSARDDVRGWFIDGSEAEPVYLREMEVVLAGLS
jgi:hypothetical protein